jgi:hypothetical protein
MEVPCNPRNDDQAEEDLLEVNNLQKAESYSTVESSAVYKREH